MSLKVNFSYDIVMMTRKNHDVKKHTIAHHYYFLYISYNFTACYYSLVPRPLPAFHTKKNGRGPGMPSHKSYVIGREKVLQLKLCM